MEKKPYQLEHGDVIVTDKGKFPITSIRNDGGTQGYTIRCEGRNETFRFDRSETVTVE